MIPYINFRQNNNLSRNGNPFENSDIKMRLLIDESVDMNAADIELLYSLNKDPIQIISTGKKCSQRIEMKNEHDDLQEFDYIDEERETVSHHAVTDISEIKRNSKSLSQSDGEYISMKNALIVSRIGRALDVHLLVTSKSILLDNKDKGIINVVQPITLGDAISVIGLLLRTRNKYEVLTEKGEGYSFTTAYSRWNFFWAGAREYLSVGWKLVSSTNQLNEKTRNLSLTIISRVSNILKCRDEIQKNLLIKQSNSSVDEAIFYFEYYLLNISAAFDVLARVIDEIYCPVNRRGERLRNISWRGNQPTDWAQTLSQFAPEIATSMALESHNRDVLEFVSKLRNYIHAEGLLGSQHSIDGKTAPMLLHIPINEVPSMKPIIERLFGTDAKGQYVSGDNIFLEIGTITERLTPMFIQVLSEIISLIDYTKIANYDYGKVEDSEPNDWYAKTDKDAILKLIGITQ